MSVLIGESFLERLKTTRVEYFRAGELLSIQDHGMSDPLFRDVKALFERRHIYAHELATKFKVSAKDLAVDSIAGTILLWGTEALVEEVIAAANC